MAEGTFEIIWQERAEKISVFFSRSEESTSLTTPILDIFPAKIKNIKNVKSKG